MPAWILFFFLLAVAPGVSQPAQACGFEPSFKGGLRVSYPGSLELAMAVAEARRSGVLPPPGAGANTSEDSLAGMVADLRRLQSRLSSDRAASDANSRTSFSVVLVGPGLWSHYVLAAEGGAARYHTPGPRIGEGVVMLHHSVLLALLEETLTADRAMDQGLLVFTGGNSAGAQKAFEASFRG